MIPTRPVMELIIQVNTLLIKAKYHLIEAEKIASTEEKIHIEFIQNRTQDSIQEILKEFFPETEFDPQTWFKRGRSADTEHNAKMQKILEDAVATGAFDDGEGKPTITKGCHFDYSDDTKPNWKDEPWRK